MHGVDTIKVLVQHGDPLVCAGLTAMLREQADMRLVAPGSEWIDAADVVIADDEFGPGFIAADMGAATLTRRFACKVLILSRRDSEGDIRHALELGARGYLTAGVCVHEVLDAVRTVHRGLRHIGAGAARRLADSLASEALTGRETQVMRLLVKGHGNKAIALQLGIAVGTVKSHLKAIFQKLDASSRTEVAAVAERRGLLTLPHAVAPARSATRPPSRSIHPTQPAHPSPRSTA